MKKKLTLGVILLVLVAAIMATSIFVANIDAAEALEYKHEDGNTYTYKVVGDTVTITGCDLASSNVSIPAEIAGKPVTTIGKKAFYQKANADKPMSSIVFPDSVTTVEADAFNMGDGKFTSAIVLDLNKIVTIGDRAFRNWRGLATLTIPDTVESIGAEAFAKARALTSIHIGSGVNYIGSGAFSNIGNESGVEITSLTVSENNAKYYVENMCIVQNGENGAKILVSGFKNFSFPAGITEIGDGAFHHQTAITSITIPGTVTKIGNYAFYNCTGLKSLTISEGVKTIGASAFSIGDAKFKGVTGTLTIPNSVTSIGDKAFYGWYGITGLSLGENVETIGDNAFFQVIGANNTMTSLKLPAKLKTIGEGAFHNWRTVTNLVIPDSVTTIGKEAFFNWRGVKTVEIGAGVKSIGVNVLGSSHALTSITVADGNSTYEDRDSNCIIKKDTNTLVAGCKTSNILDSIEHIGDFAFNDCRSIPEIVIPEGVLTIGESAFANCYTSPTKIVISDTVTDIKKDAFNNCSIVTELTIGNSVKTIGEQAFYNLAAYKGTLRIPDSVKTIGVKAFYSSENIEEVIIGLNVTTIKNSAFSGCSALSKVSLPKSLTTIEYAAFVNCKLYKKATDTTAEFKGDVYYEGSEEDYAAIEWTTTTDTNGNKITQNNDISPALKNTPRANIHYGACVLSADHEHAFTGELCDNVCDECMKEIGESQADHYLDPITGICMDCEAPSRFTFEVNEDGSTVTITDIRVDNTAENVKIVIPATLDEKNVTAIANSACAWGSANYQVVALTIGENVVTIGDNAFNNNRAITTLTIPASVTTIGESAFFKCDGIKTLAIGANVATIGEQAFGRLSDLETITATGNSTFAVQNDCLVDTVNKIVLVGAQKETVIIPEGMVEIGAYAFYGPGSGKGNIKTIIISSGVTTIGTQAFDATAVETLVIPKSVTTIGNGLVANTALKPEFNPNEVAGNIYYEGSEAEYALIEMGGSNAVLTTYATVHYDVCLDTDDYAIHNYVDGACSVCGADQVKAYEGFVYKFNDDGSTLTVVAYIGSATELNIPAEIEGKAVTAIGEEAFTLNPDYDAPKEDYEMTITKITIPEGIVTIGARAFFNFRGITEIVIPDSVTTIGEGAFFKCVNVKSLTIGKNVTTIEKYGISRLQALDTVTIDDKNTAFELNNGCLIDRENKSVITTLELEKIVIPAGIETIEDYAFYSRRKVSTIAVPQGVTYIGEQAFQGAAASVVIIPKSVTTIANAAFANMSNLDYGKGTVYYEGNIGDYAAINWITIVDSNGETVTQNNAVSPALGNTPRAIIKYNAVCGTDFDHVISSWKFTDNKSKTVTGVCAVCGEMTATTEEADNILKLQTASLTLGSRIAINFKLNKEIIDTFKYTDLYATFQIGDRDEVVVYDYYGSGKYYVFDFGEFGADMMGDTITATLYAKYDGENYISKSVEYSVLKYCQNMLKDAVEVTPFYTMLVEMLNYGAAVQLHTNHNVESLVNAGLTDEQKTWVVPSMEPFGNDQDFLGTPEDPKLKWKAANLLLGDAVYIRVKIEIESLEGVTIKAMVGDFSDTYALDAEDADIEALGNNQYYFKYSRLGANQMREPVHFQAYKDGKTISTELLYSVETYAFKNQDPNTTLGATMIAMMKYGEAAKAYVDSSNATK